MPIIIGEGKENDNQSLKVSTKTGKHIDNLRRFELPPEDLKEAVKVIEQTNPEARLRTLSNTYNCMGMVFASRRTWIDPGIVYKILREDEYSHIDADKLVVGDIVLYKKENKPEHIGIVVNIAHHIESGTTKITVLSKWGAYGEYFHDINDVNVEMCGHPDEYWTDRRLNL